MKLKLQTLIVLLIFLCTIKTVAQQPGTVKHYTKLSGADTSIGHSRLFRVGYSACMLHDMDGDGNNEFIGHYYSINGNPGLVLFRLNSNGQPKSYKVIAPDSAGFTGYLPTDFTVWGFCVTNMGDMDGNGIDDIAVSNSLGNGARGELFILFLNSNGTVDSFKQIRSYQNGLNVQIPTNSGFGLNLTNIGDLDGDGINDIAVGAPGIDTSTGSIWVLFLNRSGTVKNYKIIGNNTGGFGYLPTNTGFGSSIAGIGDLDGDGHPDIITGDERNTDATGEAWTLFLNNDGTVKNNYHYLPNTTAFPDTSSIYGGFGTVANIGDIDGDTVTDVAICQSGYIDTLGQPGGRIYITFLNRDGSVKATQPIDRYHGGFSAHLRSDDIFGTGITGIGDFDKDGIYDICAGFPLDDDWDTTNSNTNSGAFYFLYLNGIPINTSVGDVITNETKGYYAYPNPTSDKLIVRNRDNKTTLKNVTVYDMSGRVYLSQANMQGSTVTLNVSTFTPGIYIIKPDNSTEVIQFVKK